MPVSSFNNNIVRGVRYQKELYHSRCLGRCFFFSSKAPFLTERGWLTTGDGNPLFLLKVFFLVFLFPLAVVVSVRRVVNAAVSGKQSEESKIRRHHFFTS